MGSWPRWSSIELHALGIAKLHGMLVDKQQQLEPRADDMTPDELRAELKDVQAEIDALDAKSETQH